jgi:hypothetical protein
MVCINCNIKKDKGDLNLVFFKGGEDWILLYPFPSPARGEENGRIKFNVRETFL